MNLIKQYGPLVLTLAGTIGAAVFTPAFIAAHPGTFAWLNAGAQFLHAVLPSIFETKGN
jgi:plastocyanin